MIFEIHTDIKDKDPEDDRIVFKEYNFESLEALMEILEACIGWERRKRKAKKNYDLQNVQYQR